MARLQNEEARADLRNRLKRAEGQLRGVQRMLDEDAPCAEIAAQLSAVRRALDSACVRMTVCFMEQELRRRLADGAPAVPATERAGGVPADGVAVQAAGSASTDAAAAAEPAVDPIDAVMAEVQGLLGRLR